MPLAVFCLSGLLLLDWCAPNLLFSPPNSRILSLTGNRVTLEGVVATPVERREFSSRAIVSLTMDSQGSPITGKIQLTSQDPPSFERGDRIRFEVTPRRPKRYRNPGGFDYRRYLTRQGIHLTGFLEDPAKVAVLERGHSPLKPVDRLRDRIAKAFDTLLPVPEAGFLKALTVGDRSGLSAELWDDFRRTGTAHLLAVSGQHIAMVGGVFFALFLWGLKRSERLMLRFSVRRIAWIATIIPIFFYTILVGSPPSAVRAALLGAAACLAFWWRRDLDPWSALAAAALLIGVFDPSSVFSASFQLSFLAVAGILLFVPVRAPSGEAGRLRRWSFHYLVRPFWITVGASVLTAPLIAYQFHNLSLSSLVTNLWAVPATGLILIFSFVSLFSLAVIPPVGKILLLVTGHLAGFFLLLIGKSAEHSWVLSFCPTEGELALGFALALLTAVAIRRPHLRWAALGGLILLMAGWFSYESWPRSKDLEVTFLDVGEGDAALVMTPEGKSLLIDGGGFLVPTGRPPPFDVGKEVVVPYLKRRGVERIDAILLTHPHPDHYGGLEAVFQNFPVGQFWWNGQRFPDATFDSLLQAVRDEGTLTEILRAGMSFSWGGVQMSVLYPDAVDSSRNMNDNSLVIRLSSGAFRLLLPGDVERKGESSLVSQAGLQADLLKIPHHASKTSSSIPLIEAVSPAYAVASLGEGNFFGFPHPGVLEKYERRGVRVFRTDRDGAVSFRVPPDFPRRPIAIETFSSEE